MLAAWLCRVPVRVYVVRGFRFETATGWRSPPVRRTRVGGDPLREPRDLQLAQPDGGRRAERRDPPGRGEVIGAGSGNGIDVDPVRRRSAADPCRGPRRSFGLPADAHGGRFRRPVHEGQGHRGPGRGVRVDARGRPGVWLLLVGQFEDGDPVPPTVAATIEQRRADRGGAVARPHRRRLPGDGRAGVPVVPRGPAERAARSPAVRRAGGRLRRNRHGRRGREGCRRRPRYRWAIVPALAQPLRAS